MPFVNETERVHSQPAYILHRRHYRNTSLILDVFACDYGRLSLVAKGANSQKSRIKGLLQAFQPLQISWVRKSELGTLTSAESLSPPIALTHDALYCGMYLNEILLKLLGKDDPHADIFEQYDTALRHLASHQDQEVTLRQFENELLQSIGYEIDFFHEANTHEPLANEKFYQFVPEHGFVECLNSNSTTPRYSGKSIIAISQNDYTEKTTRLDARKIFQIRLKQLLGSSELKTRELYKAFLSSRSN